MLRAAGRTSADAIYEADRDDLIDMARQVQLRLEAIAEQVGEESRRGNTDPDASLAPTDALRKIRVQLAQLEEQMETSGESTLARKVRGEARWTAQVARNHGSEADRQEVARLTSQLQKYADADDPRGLKWVQEQLRMLRGPILENVPGFWEDVLNYLKAPGRRFVNQQEASAWLEKADRAREERNLPQLRDAVNKAYALQPPDKAEVAKEQATQSGLRGT